MFKWQNLKVKTLLIGVITILAALLAICNAGGILTARTVADEMKDFSVQDFTVGQIRLLMESNRSQILQALQHNPALEWSRMHDHPLSVHFNNIKKNSEEITNLWSQYQSHVTAAEEKELGNNWYEASGKLGMDSIGAAARAVEEGQWDEAQKTLIRSINPTYRIGNEAAEKLTTFLTERAESKVQGIRHQIDVASYTLTTLLVLGLIMALVLGTFTLRMIMRPLRQAIEVAHRVAEGDLREEVAAESTNEFGSLLSALSAMNKNLKSIVSQVRAGTNTISSATSEIASGNIDLSRRTEQQAAALEETAASIEQLTSAAKQSGDNARQADDLAATASTVAAKGGEIVAEVVQTIGAINDSSNKIRDIIGVIDGIAFQTNILALNAAVEAARAGEQGRGFAVVASEVRNLAQRSANAAKEIKTLINASVERVEHGSKLADQAGGTMVEIVASAKRVSDIMSEINASIQEQHSGIGQVNHAIAEMDNTTQSNAAMVEQATAASQALQEQAAALAEAVGFFKVDTNNDGAPNRPPVPKPRQSSQPGQLILVA